MAKGKKGTHLVAKVKEIKLTGKSKNVTAEQISALKGVFPQVCRDGMVDF